MNECLTFSIFCSFDIQLEAFGVDTLELKKPAAIRYFKSWIKDWEEEARLNPGEVNEIKLREKYKNLKFLDPDTGQMCRFSEEQMKFLKEIRGRILIKAGWLLWCMGRVKMMQNHGKLELCCARLLGRRSRIKVLKLLRRRLKFKE